MRWNTPGNFLITFFATMTVASGYCINFQEDWRPQRSPYMPIVGGAGALLTTVLDRRSELSERTWSARIRQGVRMASHTVDLYRHLKCYFAQPVSLNSRTSLARSCLLPIWKAVHMFAFLAYWIAWSIYVFLQIGLPLLVVGAVWGYVIRLTQYNICPSDENCKSFFSLGFCPLGYHCSSLLHPAMQAVFLFGIYPIAYVVCHAYWKGAYCLYFLLHECARFIQAQCLDDSAGMIV